MGTYLLTAVVGYIVGSTPFFLILKDEIHPKRSVKKTRTRNKINLNRGATLRKCIVFSLDVYKGAVTAYLFGIMNSQCVAVVTSAIVLGHMFPLFEAKNKPSQFSALLGCMALVPYVLMSYIFIFLATTFAFKQAKLAPNLAMFVSYILFVTYGGNFLAGKIIVGALCILIAIKTAIEQRSLGAPVGARYKKQP